MVEGHVKVPYIIEEMDFIFGKEQRCRDGMHRRIAPALKLLISGSYREYLVKEAARMVEIVKERLVAFVSPQIQRSNFKIGPLHG